MFGKKSVASPYTIEQATAELDALLARAQDSRIPAYLIGDLLESRTNAWQRRVALNISLSTTPITHVFPGP